MKWREWCRQCDEVLSYYWLSDDSSGGLSASRLRSTPGNWSFSKWNGGWGGINVLQIYFSPKYFDNMNKMSQSSEWFTYVDWQPIGSIKLTEFS